VRSDTWKNSEARLIRRGERSPAHRPNTDALLACLRTSRSRWQGEFECVAALGHDSMLLKPPRGPGLRQCFRGLTYAMAAGVSLVPPAPLVRRAG
jgi:hypothetical protein